MRKDPLTLGAGHAAAPTVDPALFREAMSRVAAAVHIVTTAGPAGIGGITASAVTSVTVEPPMMLFCINKTSLSAARIIANGVFCINTLAPADRSLADIFAGRSELSLEARFTHGGWGKLLSGSPVLSTAVVAFDCRFVEAKEVATHLVVIGAVAAVEIASEPHALLYVQRQYRILPLD